MTSDDSIKITGQLNNTIEKIEEISKQQLVLKHEYRRTKDPIIKLEIKKKWNISQKKLETLENRRRVLAEKKHDVDFKKRWELMKIHKLEMTKFLNALTSQKVLENQAC